MTTAMGMGSSSEDLVVALLVFRMPPSVQGRDPNAVSLLLLL